MSDATTIPMTASTALPAVPPTPVDPAGHPLVGTYAGALDEVRWGYPTGFLRGQVRRALGRRRWFQATFIDGTNLTVSRISDDGLTGGAFVWRVDLHTGREAIHAHIPGLPLANVRVGPIAGVGTDAFARLPHARMRLRRPTESSPWHLEAFLPGSAIEVSLDAAHAPTPVVIIGEAGPIDGIYAQRYVGLQTLGHVRIGNDTKHIAADARGWLEYANGFYPKPFAWTTATFSHGDMHAVLSDIDGIGGPTDSAFWQGPTPRALSRTRFEAWSDFAGQPVPRRIMLPSEISDGRSGLSFEPRALKELSTGLGPSSMRWRYIAGRFSGVIAGATIADVPGLLEVRTLGR